MQDKILDAAKHLGAELVSNFKLASSPKVVVKTGGIYYNVAIELGYGSKDAKVKTSDVASHAGHLTKVFFGNLGVKIQNWDFSSSVKGYRISFIAKLKV